MKIKVKQVRAFAVDSVENQAEQPFISMSLSSETPYLRSFGNEILLHGPENIDMSRTLPNGLPLLVSHDGDKLPVGRLKNVRLDATSKKLRADAYFSNRPEAQAVRQDILDGIVADVSIGYKILDYEVEKSMNEDPNNVFVTRWLPYEGSMVAIAADHNVGVGRAEDTDEELEIDLERGCKPEEKAMATCPECGSEMTDGEVCPTCEAGKAIDPEDPEDPAEEVADEAAEEVVEDPAEEAVETPVEESIEEEEEEDPKDNKKSKSELLDMNASDLIALKNVAMKLGSTEAEIDSILSRSATIDEARKEVLTSASLITSSKTTLYKEKKTMTNEMIYRSLASAIKGDFASVDESLLADGFLTQTGARSFKAELFTRANEMTTAAKGVNTIYEQNIGFLDLLRARTAVLQAGAKTRSGNGSLSYVRQKTAVAATLRSENPGATTTNTYADFEKVNYIPKALTAKVYLTDELQKETLLDLQSVLKADMVKQFGLAIDSYAINGNTSPAITGLLSAANITAGTYNKNLGVAALPTWATVNALKAAVDTKAVDLASCNFLVTPGLLGVLETTAKLSNGSAIADGGKINGFGVLSTSNMPVATLNHSMIFGDFSNLEICLQGPTEFMIDTQSRFDEGITILTARQYFDVGVLQPSAFAKCENFLIA